MTKTIKTYLDEEGRKQTGFFVSEVKEENNNFTSQTLEEDKNPDDITFTTRVTKEDATWFEHGKRIIMQSKNSTAMKQLARIGYLQVLQDEKTKELLNMVLTNAKNNKRTGVTDSEFKIK